MNKCPFNGSTNTLRGDLPPLTDRIKKLPIDERGYPVPFFVPWINGKPEFQMADGGKLMLCKIQKLCWVCGEKLAGERKAFVIGPMCAVNRVTSEPPSHLECCEWSVKGCPFMTKPKMVRRDNEVVEKHGAGYIAGIGIDRNPGVMLIWETLSWEYFPDHKGRKLIRVGEPLSVSWWREGRPATREEVCVSISTGLPKLLEHCHSPEDQFHLGELTAAAMKLIPKV